MTESADEMDVSSAEETIVTTEKNEKSPPSQPPSEPPTKRLKKQNFIVKKWLGIALWGWDILVDTCAICRCNIMELCVECQAQTTDVDECTVAWGVCNHAFHLHCIAKWLKTRAEAEHRGAGPVVGNCPLDNRKWEYKKFGN